MNTDFPSNLMNNFSLKSTNELIEFYLSEMDFSTSSKKVYYYSLTRFFSFLEKNNYSQLNRKIFLEYKESLNSLQSNTVKRYLSSLKSFFLWIDEKLGSFTFYPMLLGIKSPKVSNYYKKDPLTSDQIVSILNNIDKTKEIGKRDFAIILLASTTGLRPSEITELNVGDISSILDENIIFIKSKGHHDKDEYVKIGSLTDQAIRDYLNIRGIDLKIDDPIFVGTSNYNKNKRLTPKGISKIIRKHLDKNGLLSSERISPYSLRHSCATLALSSSKENMGNCLSEIQQVLRHSDIRSSMAYIHPLSRKSNNTEIRIDKIISEKIKN